MQVEKTDEDVTLLADDVLGPLAPLWIRHPRGTFAPTPASRVSLAAIARWGELLSGIGIDWGTGTGCLALAAARLAAVERVVGLELSAANVHVARENAVRNGLKDKATFVEADSYAPREAEGRRLVAELRGRVGFLLANPPASYGDDGFSFRRIVLAGARDYLQPGASVFLSLSRQYGMERVLGLTRDAPGYEYERLLASSGRVPFDLGRADLLSSLEGYAAEEERGGLPYVFWAFPEGGADEGATSGAREALARFRADGLSPLTEWQVHLFRYTGDHAGDGT